MVDYILGNKTITDALEKINAWIDLTTNSIVTEALKKSGFSEDYISKNSEEFHFIHMPLDNEQATMLRKFMLVHNDDKIAYVEVFLDLKDMNVVIRTQEFNDGFVPVRDEDTPFYKKEGAYEDDLK